jgi:hypothetical protein
MSNCTLLHTASAVLQLDQCLLAVAVLALAARFLLLLHLSPKTREVDLKEAAKLVCIYMHEKVTENMN